MFKDGHAKEGLQPRQRGRGHGGRGTTLGRGSWVRTPKKIRTEECCWVSLIRRLLTTLAREVSEELVLVGEKPDCSGLRSHPR